MYMSVDLVPTGRYATGWSRMWTLNVMHGNYGQMFVSGYREMLINVRANIFVQVDN